MTDSPRSARTATITIAFSLVSAVAGFFFGFAPDDASDFKKRANDCAELLHNVAYGGTAIPHDAALADRLPNSDPRIARLFESVARFHSETSAVDDKCPMSGDSEYLHSDDVTAYKHAVANLFGCTSALLAKSAIAGCDYKWLKEQCQELAKRAKVLENQAVQVSRWSIPTQAIETAKRFFE